MANRIYIPYLNSLKFVEQDPALIAQYFNKGFDNSLFSEIIFDWQQRKCYCQKWSVDDSMQLQFESNYDPITIELINSDGDTVLSVAAQNIRVNKYQPDYFIYEVGISFADVTPGYYQFKMTTGTGTPKIFISEPLQVIDDISNTLYFEYKNSTYYGDVVFETGISMSMRINGSISAYKPGSKDIVYEDQVLNETILTSQPYRTWKLFIGGSEGVPSWVIDKLNYILGCDSLKIDGRYYTKAEGAKWEENTEENYPMSGWSIDLRESIQRNSAVFDSDGGSGRKLLVAYNIESKGFGDISENTGSNIITITDIE